MFTKILSSGAIIAAGVLYAGAAYAGPPSLYADKVRANPDGFAKNVTLTVSGPNGFNKQEFSSFGSPSLSIAEKGKMADGLYTWQTTSMTSEKVLNPKRGFNNGRPEGMEKEYINKSVTESGTFRVVNGVISKNDDSMVEGKSRTRGVFGK